MFFTVTNGLTISGGHITSQQSAECSPVQTEEHITAQYSAEFITEQPARATPEVRLTADTGKSVENNQPLADVTGSLEQGMRTLGSNSREQSPGRSPVDSLQWPVSSGQSPVDGLQLTVSSGQSPVDSLQSAVSSG